MKFSVLFVFFLIVEFSVCAQTENSSGTTKPDQFLWFHGSWTLPSTFAIEKDSPQMSNGTVTISQEGNIHLQSVDIDKWDNWVNADLKKVDNWETQLNSPANNVDLTTNHFNKTQVADVADQKKEFEALKIDKSKPILNSSESNEEKISELLASDCVRLKPLYDEVMSYYHAHQNDKDADFQNPVPPQLNYECSACDSMERQNNDTIVARYTRKFQHPEDTLIKRGLEIERTFALMGINQHDAFPQEFLDLFRQNQKDPSQSGPCAYVDLSELNNAILEIALHVYQRAEKLLEDNRKNFLAAKPVIQTYLAVARSWALMGGVSDNDSHHAEMISLIQQNFDYYNGKLKQNDWAQIGNIPLLLNFLRDEQLLGESSEEAGKFLKELTSIINNFQLSVEMDVKVGSSDSYNISHLKGNCYIIPDFQRDSEQCYRWVIADDQALDVDGIRKTKPQQQIDCQIIDNEIVTGGTRPAYIGTKNYVTNLERLHMDFCHPGKDTLLLTGFNPNPESDGIWQFPYNIKQNLGINETDQYFRSIETMQKLALSGNAESAAMKMKAEADKLKTQMEALQQKMNASNDKLAYYQQIMEMAQKMKNLTSNINLAPILYIDFQLPVRNNSPEMVNNRFDAKLINPLLAGALVYGYYTVKIENKSNEGK